MSDEGYEQAARLQARKLMAEAAGVYADAYDVTAGALCTGYVGIFEFTSANGSFCMWVTGSGAEPDQQEVDGYYPWRVEGLVRHVLRDIDRANVSHD